MRPHKIKHLRSLFRRGVDAHDVKLLAQHGYDLHTGLLNASGLERALEIELSRARRHGRPLALIHLRIVLPVTQIAAERRDEQQALLARAIANRARAEDQPACTGPFEFSMLAAETDNGAAIADAMAGTMRTALVDLGYGALDYRIALGWATHPADGTKAGELLEVARAIPLPGAGEKGRRSSLATRRIAHGRRSEMRGAGP